MQIKSRRRSRVLDHQWIQSPPTTLLLHLSSPTTTKSLSPLYQVSLILPRRWCRWLRPRCSPPFLRDLDTTRRVQDPGVIRTSTGSSSFVPAIRYPGGSVWDIISSDRYSHGCIASVYARLNSPQIILHVPQCISWVSDHPASRPVLNFSHCHHAALHTYCRPSSFSPMDQPYQNSGNHYSSSCLNLYSCTFYHFTSGSSSAENRTLDRFHLYHYAGGPDKEEAGRLDDG